MLTTRQTNKNTDLSQYNQVDGAD